MKRWRYFYGIAAVLVLALAIVGCESLNEKSTPVTAPENSEYSSVPGLSAQPGNFWVTAGTTDHFGVHMGKGSFMVNVPERGVYLLTYYTKKGGPFHMVAQVEQNSLLHVGLLAGDEVLNTTIVAGDASALAMTSPEAQNFGSVIVFYRPGFIGTWGDFFVVNPQNTLIILIQNGVIMVKTLSTKGEITTKKTKKTKKTKITTKKTRPTVKTGKSGAVGFFGVYIGSGSFIVDIPKTSVYLLTYYTKKGGPYYLVAQAEANASLIVGLLAGDEAWRATIVEADASTLALTSTEAQNLGTVTVYYAPDFSGTWSDFVVLNPQNTLVTLIQDGVVPAE